MGLNPIGEYNDHFLLDICKKSAMIVCGWGTHGNFQDRQSQVLKLMKDNNITLHCLGTNHEGMLGNIIAK